MKKLLAILCAAMLLVACCIPVLADGDTKGSITITNAVENQNYSIYLMATVKYNDAKTAYEYIAVDAWVNFFEANPTYFAYDAATKVVKVQDGMNDKGAEIAALAMAYAATVTETATKVAEGNVVKFEDLALGYYLIDSSVGTLCILDTTVPDFEKADKNATPSVDKVVQEDSTNNWGPENDATIGDVVNYKTTINVVKGAEGYVLHDKMDKGLTFNAGSVKVYLDEVIDGNLVDTANYGSTVECSAGCTFHVAFDNDYIKTVVGHNLIVTYSATINENAEIGKTGAETENSNETWLQYGESSNIESNHDVTETYVFSFDLVKTDVAGKILDGAQFKLYDAATGGNEIKVVKVSDGIYRVAVGEEVGVEIVPVDGKATIQGLDSATYYLEETVAPEGYNKLTARKDVTINGANNDATIEVDVYKEGGVQVINKTGAVLPETGGFGTTMFILIGGGLMLCTGILLVTKKRMEKIAD